MLAEKMRVHILAKDLNVASKDIIAKCRAEGIDTVKNHMSTLSAGLHATILEWFSEGLDDSALETAKPVDLKKVRAAAKKTKRKSSKNKTTKSKTVAVEDGAEVPAVAAEATIEAVALMDAPKMENASSATLVTEVKSADQSDWATAVVGELVPPEAAEPPTITGSVDAPTAERDAPVTTELSGEAPATESQVGSEGAPEAEQPSKEAAPEIVTPAGPQHVPAPAKLQGPRVVRYEAPEEGRRPPRRDKVTKPPGTDTTVPLAPATPRGSGQAPVKDDRSPMPAAGRRRTRINPRRAASSLQEAGEKFAEWRDRDLQERRERLAGATGRRILHRRSSVKPGTTRGLIVPAGPITQATVHEPIRMKEFCSATGLNFIQLLKVLRDEHGLIANINMILAMDTAELLALHFGIDLEIVAAKTLLDDVEDEFANRVRNNVQLRPPVVAMLGHVDHGKTSLLDAIRRTQVAAGEDGGITQHISSYHIQTPHGAVTFLDTPGHEAFAAMRARGAGLTDVVVLVIAADDGVMPQTIEALNHAKAAEVPIVVALNKIDLGTQNRVKIYGQLAEHGLTPSGEWGGEVDVIDTSAVKGEGIDDLLEHLADMSHLLEFKSDPTAPATGTVIEAETKPGVGAVVQVLIQDGTLSVGDVIVCGNSAGKVRAILDDQGQRIRNAGPAMPVEIWGLDEVPLSGDRFYQLDRLQRAKDIAAEIGRKRLEKGRQQSRKVASLQELLSQRDADEIPELNLVIKADVDGSVAALKQALATLPTDEVRLAIRHAGVGQVNDSDILLAATSNGVVVAFRVDMSTGARRLRDQHGVDVRSYRVIYNVCDDIKKALEGLLAPLETVESRASAEVREVFRLSRKDGVIAGSFLTDGTLVRDHLVKIVRDGVIVREGARIASLRRFKDDVKEVRTGMECGIRIEDFDDVHVGDIIESYEIVKTARTL